jgi:hypothetical protein
MSNTSMKNKSRTILILAPSFLLAGCGRNDADFAKRIPGTWKQEMRTYTNTLTIVSDGTFAYSRITTNIQSTFTNTGIWRIRGGSIVLTATNRIGEHPLPLGELFKAKIVRLDDRQWEFDMHAGQTGKFER